MAEVLRRFGHPEEWAPHRLGDISSRITSRYSSGPTTVLTISGSQGLVDQEAYFSRRVASKDLSTYYVLRRGDFAYNKSYSSGYPFGAIARLEKHDEGVVSPLYICFRITSRQCSPEFLAHAFEAGILDERLNTIAREGSRDHGLLNVRVEEFFDSEIQLPKLAVQRRIAEILSTVDEAIEQTAKLIAKHQQIKAGLMHDLFTRGLTPDGRLRPPYTEAPHLYKDSPLGPVPKEWEVRRLQEVAEIQRGKFSIRPRNDPRYYGGDYPFIQTGDVSMAVGRILTSYVQTLNSDGLAVSRLFSTGTVMVTIAANIADTCILGIPMCAPDSLVGVTPRPGELSRFLELCLRQRKRWFESRAPKTAQRNINLEDLHPLEIPYPETKEQGLIAERYEACELVLIENERHLDTLSSIKRGLMHDLLTGEVQVDTLSEEESGAASSSLRDEKEGG